MGLNSTINLIKTKNIKSHNINKNDQQEKVPTSKGKPTML